MKRSYDVMAKINTYKRPETTDSVADSAAHFLDWAAVEMPLLPLPWNVVFKAIHGVRTTPTLVSKDVIALRKKSSSIRHKLFEKYHRELATVPGQGVCATVSSDHVAGTRGKVTYQRILGATRSFERTMTLVNPKEMKDPSLKSWVEKTNRALGDMNLSDRLNKLLPPGAPESNPPPPSKRGVEKK